MSRRKKNLMTAVDLLPNDLRLALPALNSQAGIPDPIVYAKFRTRDSGWVWYVTEGSPQDNDFLFFGFVIGLDEEWGYFSHSEVTERWPPWQSPIERDVHFKPDYLRRVMAREHC